MAAENELQFKQAWDESQAINLRQWSGSPAEENANQATPIETRPTPEVNRREALLERQARARQAQAAPSLAESSLAYAPITSTPEPEESSPTAESQGIAQQVAQQQTQNMAQQQAMMSVAMAGAQQQAAVAKGGSLGIGGANIQDQVEKAAKKTIMDSFGYITEAIADSLDLGTGSVSMIVTFIEHALFVSWIHLRLFVYYFDRDGQSRLLPLSKIISPLEAKFGPLDLSRVIPPVMVHFAVICFDILFLILVFLFLGFGLLIIMAYAKFMIDPIGAITEFGPILNRFGIIDNLVEFVL